MKKIRKRTTPKRKRSQRAIVDTELGRARRELEGAGYDVTTWTNREIRDAYRALTDLDSARAWARAVERRQEGAEGRDSTGTKKG